MTYRRAIGPKSEVFCLEKGRNIASGSPLGDRGGRLGFRAYLIEALNGPLEGEVFPVGNRLIIGREADVDIQLIQKGVSRQHAAILSNDDNEYFLMDLASRNGTFLGKESIGREPLKPGNVFRIGESDFIFREGVLPQMASLQMEAGQIHLASGPAVEPTLDETAVSSAQIKKLRAMGMNKDTKKDE